MRESLTPDITPRPESAPAASAAAAPIRVAYQGEPGAFSEEAVYRLWGDAAEPVPVRTFADVAHAAESGTVDYGMLPIESTLVGGVDTAYDLLAMHDGLFITAETIVPVRLALLAPPGATIAGLCALASHPLMLAQCANFLDRYRHIAPEPAWDTAAAARMVAERGDPTYAAAGSRRAAALFGLDVLAERIEDRPDTQMRFLALGCDPAPLDRGAPACTAALCTVRDVAGALVAALRPLAELGLNVSHFAARPTREPWQYQYFIEFEHRAGDSRAERAIAALRAASATSRVLGTYPRCALRPGSHENAEAT